MTDVDTSAYDAVFVDPARRGGRGRVFDPEAYSPPLSWAVDAATTAPLAALKIAPGCRTRRSRRRPRWSGSRTGVM